MVSRPNTISAHVRMQTFREDFIMSTLLYAKCYSYGNIGNNIIFHINIHHIIVDNTN